MKLTDVDARLTQLEQQIEQVKTLYEQHFAGVLRRIPEKEHSNLKNSFKSINTGDLRSTVTKFRYQALKTRLLQLETHWQKVLKEIEEGTYRRDLFLLRAKEKAENVEPKSQPPAAKSAPSKADAQLEVLYKKYSELALAQNQKVPQKDSFIRSIQTQIDAQKAKNPAAKFEIKLQKDEAGKFQVKLKVSKT